jgi:hypothetical protein
MRNPSTIHVCFFEKKEIVGMAKVDREQRSDHRLTAIAM